MERSSHWRMCSAKKDILQNSCSIVYQADCMVKIFGKYQWSSILVEFLQPLSLMKMKHCHGLIVIRLAIFWIFHSGCFQMNKSRYFVQYNDQGKMWNRSSEITKH